MSKEQELDPPEGELTLIVCRPQVASCEHDWSGWHNFEDGSGGEAVCAKCGLGAMYNIWD